MRLPDKPYIGVEIELVARLNKFLERAKEEFGNIQVVLSSTWRLMYGEKKTLDYLRTRGYTGPDFIGSTPDYGHIRSRNSRGFEISDWLQISAPKHGWDVESFVIIDDSSDMVHLMPRLCHTSWTHGFEERHIEEALALLREKRS